MRRGAEIVAAALLVAIGVVGFVRLFEDEPPSPPPQDLEQVLVERMCDGVRTQVADLTEAQGLSERIAGLRLLADDLEAEHGIFQTAGVSSITDTAGLVLAAVIDARLDAVEGGREAKQVAASDELVSEARGFVSSFCP
jgi:hypothetical protein